ncbi:polysialoglycoprotein-like [Anopheles ziemanni]|uniref:polysialoglycoprotein-like n=1 Tax=Anopheles coustani TaxID=139045 RepID=UPI00265A00E1|nr:polysialoglycoprotein-like [Anopheles coustani]XP_058176211.1 polysialoglycoprotein-like [Anopheles ziemanni]
MLLDYDGADELDHHNPVNGDHEHDSPIREFFLAAEAEELDEDAESGETESSMSWPLRSIGSDWSYFSGYTGDLDDTSESSDTVLSSLSSYVETIPDVAVDMSTSDAVEANADQEVRADQDVLEEVRGAQDVASVADTVAAVEANVNQEVRGAQCVAFRMDVDANLSDSDRTYVSSGEEYPPHESCTCGCWPEAQEAKKKQEEMDKVTSELMNTQIGERDIKRNQEDAPDASTSASTTDGVPAGKRVKLYVADGDAGSSGVAIIKKEVSDADAGPSGIKERGSDADAGPSGLQAGHDSDDTDSSSGEENSTDDICYCGPCRIERQEAKKKQEEMDKVTSDLMNTQIGERRSKRKQEDAPDKSTSASTTDGVPAGKRVKLYVADGDAGSSGIAIIKKEVLGADAGPSGTNIRSDADAGPSGLQAEYGSDDTYISSGEEYPPHESCTCGLCIEEQEAKKKQEAMDTATSDLMNTQIGERCVKRKLEDAPDASTSASTTDDVPADKRVKLYVADGDAGPSGIAIIKKEVSDADAGPSGIKEHGSDADAGPSALQAGYGSDHTYISSGEEYPPHESCTCGCWPEAQEAKKKQEAMDKVTSELMNTQVGKRGIKRKLEDAPDTSTSTSINDTQRQQHVADDDGIGIEHEQVPDAEAGPSGLQVAAMDVAYDADLTSGIENSPRASDAHAAQSLSTSKDTEPEPPRTSRSRRRRCKRSRRHREHRHQDTDSTVSEADTP